jgi:hypothetical protein
LYGAFFVKRFSERRIIGFFVRPGVRFLRPDLQYCKSRRAQELSRLAVAPTLRRTPPLPGHTLTASSTTVPAWCGRDDDQRGARFPGADQSRHDLVSGGSRTRTMMHSCASAAKLRGGGPILFPGMKAKGGNRDPATSNRHRDPLALEAGWAETVGRVLCRSAHEAGRKTIPSGITPSRTSRHRAISSLRASATIIVLRV